jgi:hypothetical protein
MPTFTNNSPIDFGDITSEEGILVISYDPDNPNDKPSVSYYENQQEFESGWSNGECPLTRKPKNVSVPLSTLSPEELASLQSDDDPLTLIDGGLESFSETSYVRKAFTEFFNKSLKSSVDIQTILERFKEHKIATIGEHHEASKSRAEQL